MKQKKSGHKIMMENLLSKVPNRFVLAIGAARRGRQILEGANPLVAGSPLNQPVLAALSELHADKVKIEMQKKDNNQ